MNCYPAYSVRTLAAIATVTLTLAMSPGLARAEGDQDEAMFRALDAIATRDAVVGYAAGIVVGGQLAYTHAFGEKELGSGAALETGSVFHWASVSKPFVATAIMQLSEAGRLDLDARLVDVLPDYKTSDPRHASITIRQLLLHTSGLPDVEDYQWDHPQYDPQSLGRWVLSESPRDLLFDPGSDRQYSNLGYETLGVVIEQVSGLEFETYMTRNIFEPLRMTDTTFYYPDVPEKLRTTGHTGAEDRRVVEHYPYNRRHAPSSTLNTNVNDMARFVMALLNGGQLDGFRILKSTTVDQMWTPIWVIQESPFRGAAMGWVVEEHSGRNIVRHFGWDDGFRSALILLPGEKSGLFIVSNDETAQIGEFVRAAFAGLVATQESDGPR
jgi:CubicO group peptidase (beta-lactamase class C family)